LRLYTSVAGLLFLLCCCKSSPVLLASSSTTVQMAAQCGRDGPGQVRRNCMCSACCMCLVCVGGGGEEGCHSKLPQELSSS
jgi:hypothetical protein